jgi:hypothetical protein
MTKKKRNFKIYFSDFFGTTSDAIEAYGAFNISLLNDLPLFVDPFLLFTSENPKYRLLHEEMVRYVLFLKEKSQMPVPPGLVIGWYHFPEVKQNWLGFSKSGNNGRGLGPDFAKSLKRNLTTVFKDFGNETGTSTHLGKLTLIQHGVGKDQISDFTCNLIRAFLAEYTQEFARKHISAAKLQKFMVPKASFDYQTETWRSQQYELPRFGSDFVLLTPVDMLTKDEAWISHNGFVEDFSAVVQSVPNIQLRQQIDNYFASVLSTKPTKREIEIGVEKVVVKYPELMDAYVKLQEANSVGATSTSAAKIKAARELFVTHLAKLVDLLGSKTEFYETSNSSYAEGMKRVNFLKDVIEKQDGYRLFYIDGKPVSRESDLQIMFKLTWFASDFSADAEVNNGRGPADFLVSYGSQDKVVIEFKLAKNTQLEKNLIAQAEIYSDASRTSHKPIKVILYFSERELDKVRGLLQTHNLTGCKEIILIDASPKMSASKS